MTNVCTTRVLGILVSLTLAAFLIGGIVALATARLQCGSRNGRDCFTNDYFCPGSHECYCHGSLVESESAVCRTKHLTWSSEEQAVLYVFGSLFWISLIASVVICICRRRVSDKYERAPEVHLSTTEQNVQEEKL